MLFVVTPVHVHVPRAVCRRSMTIDHVTGVRVRCGLLPVPAAGAAPAPRGVRRASPSEY
jgi:hypothetical protein